VLLIEVVTLFPEMIEHAAGFGVTGRRDAGDLGFRVVRRQQLMDIDAIFAASDLFLQDIDTLVIRARHSADNHVNEHLDELCADGIMPHLAVQFVGEHVAHERLVGVRRIQNPIRIRWKSQDGHLQVVAGFQPLVAPFEDGRRVRQRDWQGVLS